jgi:hypothetical protein
MACSPPSGVSALLWPARHGAVSLRAFSDWVVEVKLLLIGPRSGSVAPAGHALLFAVGAGPPHDGVRRARRLNLFHDLAGVQPAGSCSAIFTHDLALIYFGALAVELSKIVSPYGCIA